MWIKEKVSIVNKFPLSNTSFIQKMYRILIFEKGSRHMRNLVRCTCKRNKYIVKEEENN